MSDKHNLRRNQGQKLTLSLTGTETVAEIRELINIYITNSRTELVREEVRALLNAILSAIDISISVDDGIYSGSGTVPTSYCCHFN